MVFIARNPGGALVAVCTVYLGELTPGEPYYFYRMFIQPGDRIPGMMSFITGAARNYLRGHAAALDSENRPRGLVIVAENPKLMRPGMRRIFEDIGYQYAGSRNGQGTWKFDF